MPVKSHRSTFSLRPRARRLAEDRARAKSISFGEAISDLIEEAEALRPQTTLVMRKNGLPMLVPPPGTPKIDPALVRKAIEEDW